MRARCDSSRARLSGVRAGPDVPFFEGLLVCAAEGSDCVVVGGGNGNAGEGTGEDVEESTQEVIGG